VAEVSVVILRLSVSLGFLVAAVFAIACGEPAPVNFGDALPEGAIQVDQSATKFEPTELSIDVLDTVYFTNSSTAVHTVIIGDTNESGDMERGDVFSFTFPEAGEYRILCSYHPQMKATIAVE
jgi:plastocyanin